MVKLDPLVELTRNDPTCINEISLSVWPVPVMKTLFCNESAMHKNVNVKKSFLIMPATYMLQLPSFAHLTTPV